MHFIHEQSINQVLFVLNGKTHGMQEILLAVDLISIYLKI